MHRIMTAGLGLGILMAALTACAEEGPTGVGAELLGPALHTYEVTLDAADFLVADTTFDRIGSLREAPFLMAAETFGGELDARTLFRVRRPPTVTYTNADDDQVTDTIDAVVGGTVIVVVDSMASSFGPVDFEVWNLTEDWDRGTVSWTVRQDTADAATPWQTPGGTVGQRMGTGTWVSGDTLLIPLDSAAANLWNDTADARVGGLLRVTTPDRRMFITSVGFRFDVVPVGADTVVAAGAVTELAIILDPEEAVAPAAGELRVGGLPAWRSLLRFQVLEGRTVPCPPGSGAGCTVPIEDVTINRATLVLEPLAGGARRVERPIRIEGRGVLETDNVALPRSPMTPQIALPSDSVAPALFTGLDPDPTPVRVPVTFFVQRNAHPQDDTERLDWLALTVVGERSMFGYAVFGGLESARPPRLQLILSIPEGELVR